MKLKQIATLTNGISFRVRVDHDPKGNIGLIQLKDISDDNKINLEKLSYISSISIKENYYLFPNDVLLRTRGSNFRAAKVEGGNRALVAVAPLLIIRAKHDFVLSEYLQWYINRDKAQAFLHSISEGTSLKMLNRSCLEEMEIIIPPLQIQKRIVEIAFLEQKEQSLIKEIAKKRIEMLDGILMQAASGS